jgi:hypothetical protein
MSNTHAISTLTRDQAVVYGTLVPTPREPLDLDYSEAIDLLEALPGYTEFKLRLVGTRDRAWRLMARDMPGVGRRFTNLDTGMEWIGLNDIIAANDDLYGLGIETLDGRMIAMASIDR